MDLPTLWYVLIAVLFVGYFFLEGFDYGVGVLMPLIGRTDRERRAIVATIGPVWDANEVWLITAGGAIFAAFPVWYATLFSGFYLALALLLFALHGALYIALKTEGRLQEEARAWAFRIGPLATALYFLFVVLTYFYTPSPRNLGLDPGAIPILAALAMVSVRFLLLRRNYALAFAMNGVVIVLSTITVFNALYPDVLPSSLNPAWSLTIHNAASNPYSLHVMTIVALSALPFVLAYQAWTYWVFRKRITLRDTFHY